jgi:radical SAM superfamily enzyme YgiQ (UPF0313 family)
MRNATLGMVRGAAASVPPQTGRRNMEYDIALIRVNYDSHIIAPQLGLAYLSSFLKSGGYKPLLIDGLKNKLSNRRILEILRHENIPLAGITCLSAYYNEVVLLSRLLKNNGIKTIIGGVHPTFMPYQTLVETRADYAVCGEGEIPLLELLKNGGSNMRADGRGIRGVYSLAELRDENALFEKGAAVENPDDIPYPDWEQTDPRTFPPAPHGALAKYFPIATVFSTRGCPYSCKFCASPNFYNKTVRFRSPENVIGEIKLLSEKYGVREIQFEDDNLTLNREHVENICGLILKNNIKLAFSCPNGIRADKIDGALAKLMKRAGFYYCALGIESANEAILRNIGKKETLDTIQNAVSLLNKNGIVSQGFFIFGLPGETKETIAETTNFALRSGLQRAQFLILDVLPGCELWHDLKGRFVSNFSKKSYKEPEWIPSGLTREDLLRAQSNAFRRFFFRPKTFLNAVSYLKPRQIGYIVKRLFDYRIVPNG